MGFTGYSSNQRSTSTETNGWMNGVLGHFFALSRLNWAGDNLGETNGETLKGLGVLH